MTYVEIDRSQSSEKRKKKVEFKYSELKDLQSRLALVAGGKEEDKQIESAQIIRTFDEANTYIFFSFVA